MNLLARIAGPTDLDGLSTAALSALAQEIRAFLIDKVFGVGGHLGPNLGVVELTIAVHRVFDSPRDVLLFDTGHQAYVHKILTGRSAEFDSLRQADGLSGYPSQVESVHDGWNQRARAPDDQRHRATATRCAPQGDPRLVLGAPGRGGLHQPGGVPAQRRNRAQPAQ
jgi:1-deoxy-D-xylulose-5-phosphate synthase